MADHPTGAAPPVPGGMLRWPDEAKVFYLNLRARVGRLKAYNSVVESFPEIGLNRAKHDAPGSVCKWENNDGCRAFIAWAKSELKADYSKLKFSQKFERIAALGEVAVTLLERFEVEGAKGNDADHRVLVNLAKEIRPTLGEIHLQVSGEGLDSQQVLAVAEKISEKLAEVRARTGEAAELLPDGVN